jgi:hypothetical protein
MKNYYKMFSCAVTLTGSKLQALELFKGLLGTAGKHQAFCNVKNTKIRKGISEYKHLALHSYTKFLK